MHRGKAEDPTEHYVDDDFLREIDTLELNHLEYINTINTLAPRAGVMITSS